MADIPTHLRATIERFAASMGVDAAPARDGSFAFTFERSGTLAFTPIEADGADGAMMSLSRPTGAHDAARVPGEMAEGLLAAGGTSGGDAPVHVGLSRTGNAVAWTRVRADRFEQSDLEAEWAMLRRALGE